MVVLIVEDERVAARRLERLTREIFDDKLKDVIKIETLKEALIFVEKKKIDLLLLDLNLNGQDGFELLKDALSRSFQTIVVSASTDRAIEAYEYGVLDFIPKPFEKQRLLKAYERIEGATIKIDKSTKHLMVKSHGKLTVLNIKEVLYIKGAGDYSEIHLTNKKIYLHSKSLESLLITLPNSFIRIHKSYITDIKFIKNIHIHGGGKYDCLLENGDELPVSRSRYKKLKERLG